MTDAPIAESIDFAEVFAGLAYPKDTVTVNLDEKAGYQVHKITQTLAGLDPVEDKDEIEGLKASLSEVAKAAKKTEFTFYLTAIDREKRDLLREQIRNEFEIENDVFGRTKPNPEAEKAFTTRLWALHIEKVEGPGMVQERPTPENLKPILNRAPDKALADIDAKITELSGQGATDGFDTLIRDSDFLSER